jgi:hypothetical protein
MDPRFAVTDLPRDVPDIPGDLSLETLAWRALRADHQQRLRQQAEYDSKIRVLQEALRSVADQAVGLRKQALAAAAGPLANEQLLQFVDVLMDTLSQAGIIVVSPEGQEYSGDLMEIMENCAHVPDPAATVPTVAQVLVPAIIQDGRIVRMGKAVIAVPVPTKPCGPTETDPRDGSE